MFRLRRPELREGNRVSFAKGDHEKISFYRREIVKLVIEKGRLGGQITTGRGPAGSDRD
jgi:hypothetical protein